MDIERINRVYRWMVDISQLWFTRNGNVAASQNDIVGVKNDLFFICQDTQKTFPLISSELFRLKDTLFLAQGRINPVIFGEVISWLRFLENTADNNDFWNMIHPTVEQTSRKLFEDGHYANASEDAFIEINIQKGYMQMFVGAISALRNPKAHENIRLDREECKKRLVFASMLMDKLDEGVRYMGILEEA